MVYCLRYQKIPGEKMSGEKISAEINYRGKIYRGNFRNPGGNWLFEPKITGGKEVVVGIIPLFYFCLQTFLLLLSQHLVCQALILLNRLRCFPMLSENPCRTAPEHNGQVHTFLLF